ncbi:Ubiquitin-conjugating enzyme E2 15 [Taphrina deformans PYCC 5710]|uniref:E2 ubiquitin-conjugating enzyme n=1 Tax=Taphrina deformans (strain PYCC 5710 / ATCC 11124 / CBS 356.35 / IMI 108563 / JCM 9778 / NBRC 8474) TaxID=1097556 RepID=R4XEB9_TAPDE|nr:Ubiquitin-conjugating enzyme E2 15 [Taphrina deformans PYCC 5710]|eukprot:CCG82816.1 Ubiquitin-conjugating enzyme E2 15 [Taphrina deformans PYCC 5710]
MSSYDRYVPKIDRSKNTSSPSSSSSLTLQRQYREMQKNPVQGFSCGLPDESNFYEWDVLIIGPQDTVYEGGFLKARLSFPTEYPLLPPKMKFMTEMWHPNIYQDGTVCISILHAPGEDQYGYEDAGERWLPVHSVETVLISVISMLSSPNDESPANIECARQWREDPQGFKKKVRALVRRSGEEMFD